MGNGLGNIEDYENIYSYVVKGSKTSDQLKDYLVKQKGVLKKTADSQIKKIKEGNFAFLDYADEKISFNHEAFLAALDGMGKLLNYNITAEPVKKKKPEDEIAVITSGHSKNYRNERTRANGLETANKKLEAEFNQMKEELKSLAALQITTCMDKKVVALQSVKSEPTEALEEDGFLAASDSGDGKASGTLAGIYEADTSPENELSESNYIKRICSFFRHSKFFEKRSQVDTSKKQGNELTLNWWSVQPLKTEKTLRLHMIRMLYRMWILVMELIIQRIIIMNYLSLMSLILMGRISHSKMPLV